MTTFRIAAPRLAGGLMVFDGEIAIASGDKLTLSAQLTPETLRAMRARAGDVYRRVREWAGEHVELTGNWSGVRRELASASDPLAGALLGATGENIRRVARSPILTAKAPPANVTVVFREATKGNGTAARVVADLAAQEGANPATAAASAGARALFQAHWLLASPDCLRIVKGLRQRCGNDPNAAAVLGAIHCYGACCCGKIHHRAAYSVGRFDGPVSTVVADRMSNMLVARALGRRAGMTRDDLISRMSPTVDRVL